MSSLIDTSTEFGARVERRLRSERIAWMTTVTPDNAPLPRPVWFLWTPDNASEVLIYSRESPRIHNITANPTATLNLDSDGAGGDIVILRGEARIDPEHPAADQVSAYVEKYADDITRLGLTPAGFAARYKVPVRIELNKLAGH